MYYLNPACHYYYRYLITMQLRVAPSRESRQVVI